MNKPVAIIPAEQDTRARFTTAEFLRMAETGAFDDMKIELVRGELERMNPPMNNHSVYQLRIAMRLAAIAMEELVRSEIGIDLGDDTVRGCDAAVLHSPLTDNRLLRPEDILLVVEVSETTLNRDLGPKRADYARAGIPHYWVVDGERQVVHIFEAPVAGDYKEIRTVPFGSPLAVPGTEKAITLD
jgi:Uma2 family endonuclease